MLNLAMPSCQDVNHVLRKYMNSWAACGAALIPIPADRVSSCKLTMTLWPFRKEGLEARPW